jgi:hypothetical protein
MLTLFIFSKNMAITVLYYEGPMIHLGSLVAAGMSQFKSATFECTLPFFSRFRNSEDRRNFISAGAAAGIASGMDGKIIVLGEWLPLKNEDNV